MKTQIKVAYYSAVDGSDIMEITPFTPPLEKPGWYVWLKENGSGILVIDSLKQRIDLPANLIQETV